MSDPSITKHLNRTATSGPARWKRLAPLVDRELQRTAASVLRQFRASNLGTTLQPQELVNEFYLRLLRDSHRKWENRKHFFAYAAAVMRTVLIDRHRARKAAKRPQGGMGRPIETLLAREQPSEIDQTPAVEIHIAIERLQSFSPRQAEVIDLHFFAGLALDEIAGQLNISEKTVRRDWIAARAFLYAELGGARAEAQGL
jgi:RNA polymerase sigma factor (TIGR02999 family)